MAVSNLINNNEEYIKDALNNGIGPEAINSTLEDITNKTDEKGKIPLQVKNTIETIAHMKKNINSIPDKKYASKLVNENSERIKSALRDGISPNEIAVTLMESTEKANNRRTKSRLKFIAKLIVKMKQKELSLRKNQENNLEQENTLQKGRQMVLK